MKKIWIGAGIVVVIALYAIFASKSSTPSTAPQTTDTGQTVTTNQTGTAAGSNPPATSGSGTSAGVGVNIGTTATFKDGSYTGPVTDAIYGKLQIVAVVQNGQLVDVQWPVYPNAGGHTMQVSQSALPQLKQEAIASQSANVDIVSGATQTSQAFQQSLAAALAMAK